jgi:hypothetical protein
MAAISAKTKDELVIAIRGRYRALHAATPVVDAASTGRTRPMRLVTARSHSLSQLAIESLWRTARTARSRRARAHRRCSSAHVSVSALEGRCDAMELSPVFRLIAALALVTAIGLCTLGVLDTMQRIDHADGDLYSHGAETVAVRDLPRTIWAGVM